MKYGVLNPITNENIYPPIGKRWTIGEKTKDEYLSQNLLEFTKDKSGQTIVKFKKYLTEIGVNGAYLNLLLERGSVEFAKDELELLLSNREYFDTPKPTLLIKRLLEIATRTEDVVMDFFAGSGTTAQAVLELNTDGGNRKFILVQLPELCDEKSEAYKAGYKTIAEISKERIRRVIKKIEKEKATQKELTIDNGFKAFKLVSSNFKIWRGNDITEQNLVTQLDAFANPVKEQSNTQNMLYELILKAGYLLTDKIEIRKIDDAEFAIVKDELIVVLEKVNEKIIEKIIAQKPLKVLCLDNLFAGNDKLKTNTVLQMRDADIEFKTI